MAGEQDWKVLARQLIELFARTETPPSKEEIDKLIRGQTTTDIALAMEELSPEQAHLVFGQLGEQAADVLSKLDPELVEQILAKLPPESLPKLVRPLAPRDAAAIVADAPEKHVQSYLKDRMADPSTIEDLHHRLDYPPRTVGRIMTTDFIKISPSLTVEEAIQRVKDSNPEVDIPEGIYVVEGEEDITTNKYPLLGVVSIRDLLMCPAEKKVADIMEKEVVSVDAFDDVEDAAAIISKYKFMTLPVLDESGKLIGVVPSDDLLKVVVSRLHRLYTQAVGTDAKTMEGLSPLKAARKRVPWLLGTMAIELLAGLVISHYDEVLSRVILLASFMPVISAISGNVGLQSAAITVRALDTKSRIRRSLWPALKKEAVTSLIMAVICGVVLGAIGAVWSKEMPFGFVICIALICSTITAGLMGTIIPSLSKKIGFDPATTAGPFETAFQDVVGFAVFLALATYLEHWLV